MDLDFKESILCDLNRSVQDRDRFVCHAFRPKLGLAGSPGTEDPDASAIQKERRQRESLRKFLESDKIKYERALALQRLNRDPDGVFMNLAYHLAWNVIQRRAVFKEQKDCFESVSDLYLRSSELIGGYAGVLWLAPDHIHVYVESDGERPPEAMVHELKRLSREAILSEFQDIKAMLETGIDLWDEAYFVETLGYGR